MKTNEEPRINTQTEDLDDLGLDCPGCGADLTEDRVFSTYGICPACRRHFWIPGRERLQLLVDRDSFVESNHELVSIDPLVFRDASPGTDELAPPNDPLTDAVITGTGRIGGLNVVLVVVDFAHIGNSLGPVASEKIALAFEQAISRRLPVIAVVSSGTSSAPESVLSLAQTVKLAGLISRLRRASLPFVSLLTHPTTGSIYAGFGNMADLVFAEPGALIGLEASRGIAGATQPTTAEELLLAGLLDDVIDRTAVRDRFAALLGILAANGAPRTSIAPTMPIAPVLSVAEEFAIASDPLRPTGAELLQQLTTVFLELHGDRNSADDQEVITGVAEMDGVSVAVLTFSRQRPGVVIQKHGSGLRKASRLIRLALRFDLPVLAIIDGPVWHSHEDAEIDLGVTLSQLSSTISSAPIPIITVVTGVASGISTAVFLGSDRVLILEHAVLAPRVELGEAENGLPRLKQPAGLLTARDAQRLGLVQGIIPEPVGGGQSDPVLVALQIRHAVHHHLAAVMHLGTRRMLEERARKDRVIGLTSPEGAEAARIEMAQLQDLQATITRSIDDLRERLDQRQLSLPALPQLPHVAGMPARPALRRPAFTRQELGEWAERLAASGRDLADRVSEAAPREHH